MWQTAIKGMPWQNQPIAYDRQSGWFVERDRKILDWNQYVNDTNYGIKNADANIYKNAWNNTFSGVRSFISGTGSVLGSKDFIDGSHGRSSGFNAGFNIADRLLGGVQDLGNTFAQGYSDVLSRSKITADYDLALQKDNYNYNAGQIYAPTVTFPRDESLQNFVGNYCYVTRTRLAKSDLQKLDVLFNMYGYAVDEPVTKPMFNSRRYFNYIECNNLDIDIKSKDVPMYIRDLITAQLTNGVRIWHVKPNHSLYYVKNEVVK